MQVFLPHPDLIQSAKCLDNKRLNKQRVELKQIVEAMPYHRAWNHHPAVRMMMCEGGMSLVRDYGIVLCDECDRRGIKDNVRVRKWYSLIQGVGRPWWFGSKLHDSHLENLEFKQTGLIKDQPPYIWPVHKHEYQRNGNIVTVIRYSKPRIYYSVDGFIPTVLSTGRPAIFMLENYD